MMMAEPTSFDPPPVAILPVEPEPGSADEINHRIANSLQLLAAMVSIEARRIADPAAQAALDATMRRIGAIARVHRQLYGAHATGMVALDTYLAELGEDLEQSLAAAGRRVLVDAVSLSLPAEEAMAIGVIVSELVGNACKYAYAPGEPGDVRVTLHATPSGGYRLEVSDRGRGIPVGAAPQGSGLGSRLVTTMAARLGADFAWRDAAPGTRFVLCRDAY